MESRSSQQGWFLPRAVRDRLSHACPLAAGCLLATPGIPWLADASPLQFHMAFSLCACLSLCPNFFPFFKWRQSYWIRTYPSDFMLTWLFLWRPNLQTRSQAEVLVLSLQHIFCRKIQLTTPKQNHELLFLLVIMVLRVFVTTNMSLLSSTVFAICQRLPHPML